MSENLQIGGECEVRKWESFKIRIKYKWQRRLATTLYGNHTQWIYWKYLRSYSEPNTLPLKKHLGWLAEAFWSHICGSHELALEYTIRTFFPSYRSKKWRINLSPCPPPKNS